MSNVKRELEVKDHIDTLTEQLSNDCSLAAALEFQDFITRIIDPLGAFAYEDQFAILDAVAAGVRREYAQ